MVNSLCKGLLVRKRVWTHFVRFSNDKIKLIIIFNRNVSLFYLCGSGGLGEVLQKYKYGGFEEKRFWLQGDAEEA